MIYSDKMELCRIIIADDHLMVRNSVRLLLEKSDNLKVVGEAGDGIKLRSILKKIVPDIVVVDLKMPKMSGLEVIEELHSLYPDLKIIVWSGFLDMDSTRKAISAGAYGIVSKAAPRNALIAAIETVWKGGFFISPEVITSNIKELFSSNNTDNVLTLMEKKIIKLVAEGRTSREISDLLSVSKQTVDKQRAQIMKKLKLKNTVEIVRFAFKNGYFTF